MKSLLGLTLMIVLLTGCSVFGQSGVEEATYQVIKSDQAFNIEVRYYEQLILVSAPMRLGMDASKKEPFQKLFDYISGNNKPQSGEEVKKNVSKIDDVAVTQGVKIPMTAPVFMETSDNSDVMSFVLPAHYTMAAAPVPKDPDLALVELKNTHYAVIQFSGLLNPDNINRYHSQLKQWLSNNNYKAAGSYKVAGYNPPFTIPALRRNEILIPIIK